MWKWRLTILEPHHEQWEAKHGAEVHGQRVEDSAGPERDSGETRWRAKVGKEGQAWSWAGNLQAPAALFKFPAPSSSQTERKRENNLRVPLFTPNSSDLKSRYLQSEALCWSSVWTVLLFKKKSTVRQMPICRVYWRRFKYLYACTSM